MTDMSDLRQRYAISPWLLISFLVFVGLPTLVGTVYYIFLQSDIYSSEAKLAPRNRDDSSISIGSDLSSLMGQVGGVNLSDTEKDAYAVRDYVTSRAIIVDLGGASQIKEWFAATDVDILSQYRGGTDIERAWIFWTDHVTAFVDSGSGLIRIRVNAYSPDAAKALLDRIILRAEKLLNEASMRARDYNVRAAENDFQRSLAELGAAQSRLLEFQIENGIVDPVIVSREISEIIGTLRLRRAQLQANIDSDSIAGASQAAREAERAAQIQAIDHQIANFEAELTGTGTKNRKSLATMLKEYEPIRIELEFRNQMYELDSAAFENARNEAVRQQKYLMVVVAPVLSSFSSQSSPLSSALLLFASLSILWGIVTLFLAALRDH